MDPGPGLEPQNSVWDISLSRPPSTTPRAGLGTSLPRSTRLSRIRPADRPAAAETWTRVLARQGLEPQNRVWVINRYRPPRTTPRADLGTSLPRSTRLRWIRPADRPGRARSWTRVPARYGLPGWNPKIGFGLSTNTTDRPGRRRGQIWGPVCCSLRSCVGYKPDSNMCSQTGLEYEQSSPRQ